LNFGERRELQEFFGFARFGKRARLLCVAYWLLVRACDNRFRFWSFTKKLVHEFVALFLAGVLSTLLVLLPLFKDGLIRLMEVVGAVIGINGVALLLLTLLISGLMSGAGALIAASLRSFKSL
jgi:hypothetical protein